MLIENAIVDFKKDFRFASGVVHHEVLPERPARFAPLPSDCDPRLKEVMRQRGISQLYSHQEEAFRLVRAGHHVVVVTPTASGKTWCYNLPVLDTVLKDPAARALYIFPTKALASDQLAELMATAPDLAAGIKVYTYDGDTPADARRSVRSTANIVITNPDMLHTAILPHHTKWISLFENLRYVVIDEMHSYRGVFGSHFAHVVRRLERIAAYYGSHPQFILASATIANPAELACELIGQDVSAVTNNGAPAARRHFILYNPPVINAELGIRKSSTNEAQRIAAYFLERDFKTIVFARSRQKVEVLGKYLRDDFSRGRRGVKVATYRGGYLPQERRAIEAGLRSGEISGVVSTNAMELGIDIGQLDVSIIAGYPGNIASTWQQSGRAGRQSRESLTVLVATSSPLDQFMVRHPEYFFGQSPESGLINADNLIIKAEHLKCACFELPFRENEVRDDPAAGEILEYLADCRFVHEAGGSYYWIGDHFPAHEISLRSAASENFVIMDVTRPESPHVIGEMDRSSVPTQLYPGAIYLHQGNIYQVKDLDYEGCRAYVEQVVADYYTDADLAVDLKVLEEFICGDRNTVVTGHGEVLVSQMATVYKKIKYRTHENVGDGQIHLPQEDLHTSVFYLGLKPELTRGLTLQDTEGVLLAMTNLYHNLAPVFLMCDYRDLHVVPQVKAVHTGLPTIFMYDAYPGGIGLAEGLFRENARVMKAAMETIDRCGCQAGCPSCVGPPAVVGVDGKLLTRRVLEAAYADIAG